MQEMFIIAYKKISWIQTMLDTFLSEHIKTLKYI